MCLIEGLQLTPEEYQLQRELMKIDKAPQNDNLYTNTYKDRSDVVGKSVEMILTELANIDMSANNLFNFFKQFENVAFSKTDSKSIYYGLIAQEIYTITITEGTQN